MFWLVLIIALFIIATGVFSVAKNIAKAHESSCTEEDVHKVQSRTYAVLVLLTIIIGIVTSVYMTNEKEVGFVSVFGHNSLVESAGIHFKAPFVSRKYIYDATTQGMPIGYTEDDSESIVNDSLMITSDFNFVNIDFYIEYRIIDPIEYHYGTSDPEGVLRNIAQSAIRNTVGQYDVDSVMTVGKSEIEIKVFEDSVAELQKHDTGLTVTNVTIQDAEPPTAEVAAAFQAVEDAKQHAETLENQANEYKNTKLPAAEASAAAIIQAAEATKTERINAAQEEVATFEALFKEFSNNPEAVGMRMYYETIADVIPNMEIIIGKDSKVIYVTGDSESDVQYRDTYANPQG